jgi:hypothetical protein
MLESSGLSSENSAFCPKSSGLSSPEISSFSAENGAFSVSGLSTAAPFAVSSSKSKSFDGEVVAIGIFLMSEKKIFF